jgi:hypothetical protein
MGKRNADDDDGDDADDGVEDDGSDNKYARAK